MLAHLNNQGEVLHTSLRLCLLASAADVALFSNISAGLKNDSKNEPVTALICSFSSL
jgi:hypothetical protein